MKAVFLAVIFSITLWGCVPKFINKGEDLKSKGEFIQGKIIGGFPNLPLHPDALPMESYGDGENFGASFTVDKDLTEIVGFYGPALESLGWEYTLNRISETNYVFDFKNSDYQGQIIVNVASDGKTTVISVFAEPR